MTEILKAARRMEPEARRDLYRYLSRLQAASPRSWLSINFYMVTLRQRTYELGTGQELVCPNGFKAAVRRLAVMRAAKQLGRSVPKEEGSDIQ